MSRDALLVGQALPPANPEHYRTRPPPRPPHVIQTLPCLLLGVWRASSSDASGWQAKAPAPPAALSRLFVGLHFAGDEEGQLERLLVVEAGVDFGFVGAAEGGFAGAGGAPGG